MGKRKPCKYKIDYDACYSCCFLPLDYHTLRQCCAGVLLDEVADLSHLVLLYPSITLDHTYISSDETKARNAMITLMFVLLNKKCGASARLEFRRRQDFSGAILNFSSTPAEAKGLSSVGAP